MRLHFPKYRNIAKVIINMTSNYPTTIEVTLPSGTIKEVPLIVYRRMKTFFRLVEDFMESGDKIKIPFAVLHPPDQTDRDGNVIHSNEILNTDEVFDLLVEYAETYPFEDFEANKTKPITTKAEYEKAQENNTKMDTSGDTQKTEGESQETKEESQESAPTTPSTPLYEWLKKLWVCIKDKQGKDLKGEYILFNVIMCADYLEMTDLLKICAKAIADKITEIASTGSKTPLKDLREFFAIENCGGFTKKTIQDVLEQNAWCTTLGEELKITLDEYPDGDGTETLITEESQAEEKNEE